jgi:integrase
MRFSEIERAEVSGTAFVLDTTKNGRPRIIPIHPRIRSAALVPRPAYHVVRYHVAKARDALGLTGVTFHTLRHSAASEMLAAGAGLDDIGPVLGHLSKQSTMRYAHQAQERAREVVALIGKKRA